MDPYGLDGLDPDADDDEYAARAGGQQYYASEDGHDTSYEHQQSPLIEESHRAHKQHMQQMQRPRTFSGGDDDGSVDDSGSYVGGQRQRYDDEDRDSEHSFNMGHDNRQYK
jgi:hypothetical protein